ncbi:hypothetical protein [Cohaesibacter marisflavi]|uniref:hypothetical protein n=1 Tax=Cohaesibacter marisflavi TaxID=655353 RepID=UPI0029C956CF|nr:hypothetical protein [Cohaesibacter marisflavi]
MPKSRRNRNRTAARKKGQLAVRRKVTLRATRKARKGGVLLGPAIAPALALALMGVGDE